MFTMDRARWLASRARFVRSGLPAGPIVGQPKSHRRLRLLILEEARTTVAREERFCSRHGAGACAEISRERYSVDDQPHVWSQPIDYCL